MNPPELLLLSGTHGRSTHGFMLRDVVKESAKAERDRIAAALARLTEP